MNSGISALSRLTLLVVVVCQGVLELGLVESSLALLFDGLDLLRSGLVLLRHVAGVALSDPDEGGDDALALALHFINTFASLKC